MGIGAQKAATTWMYQNLARHPEIRFPAGKEVHFWDHPDGRNVQDWRDLFERNWGLRLDRLRATLDRDFRPLKQGEITPAYSFLTADQVAAIAGIYPSLRLLFNVRNPVERAWSHARMRLAREDMTGTAATDEWLFAFFDSEDCAKRTDYLTTLRTWATGFANEQMLVTVFDDIVADPIAALNRMIAHIGCARPFSARQLAAARQPLHVGRPSDIPPHARAYLIDRYRDDVAALGRMLGRDLSHWMR